ncbi:MAG TPA: hypothetical protein PKG81_03350, partial [Candidatus Omnitrophota bacterium]|nr:hypothetical protein [Candidatus Omnitrophota bacterium]
MKAKMSMSFKKSMSFKRFFSRCVKAFLAIVIGSAFLSVSSRAGEKETRAIDELSYAEIMISAVTVDMAAYIDCVPEDMAVARGVALKAIADLDEIKRFVGGISADGELSALKKMNLDISDMLISAYSMIGIGDQARVAEKMDEVIIKCEHYAETAGPVYEKYNLITDSSDLSPYEAEKKLIESVEDSETYLEALKYCDEEKYPEAGELLRKLLDKYTDKSFGDCIKLQISNCLILGNINSKTADRAAGLEEGIGLLTEILDSGKYSPVLYEAFFRWRTLEQ